MWVPLRLWHVSEHPPLLVAHSLISNANLRRKKYSSNPFLVNALCLQKNVNISQKCFNIRLNRFKSLTEKIVKPSNVSSYHIHPCWWRETLFLKRRWKVPRGKEKGRRKTLYVIYSSVVWKWLCQVLFCHKVLAVCWVFPIVHCRNMKIINAFLVVVSGNSWLIFCLWKRHHKYRFNQYCIQNPVKQLWRGFC